MMLEKLIVVLRDRASAAFDPIRRGLSEEQFEDEREKVLQFKNEFVVLDTKLHNSLVDRQFARSCTLGKEFRILLSSEISDWLGYPRRNCAGIFFVELPDNLDEEVRKAVPELSECLELLDVHPW